MSAGAPWNPVNDLRQKYPGLKDWDDQKILGTLQDPAKFRSAFPQYAGLDDATIQRNLAKLGSTAPATATAPAQQEMTWPPQGQPQSKNSVLGGFVRRGLDTIKGMAQSVTAPPQTTGEKIAQYLTPAGLPAYRMLEGLNQAHEQGAQQVEQQLKQASATPDLGGKALGYAKAASTFAGISNPFSLPAVANVNALQAQGRQREAVGQGAFDIATLAPSVPPVSSAIGKAVSGVQQAIPKVVEIAGVPIKVLTGEADPTTLAGRAQLSAKYQGVRGVKFQQVAREQQAAVKQVIRNVAQDTSDLAGPMAEHPGQAMQSAADAVHAQARPIYQALDASLTSVPDTLTAVSKTMQKAIGKVRDLGYEVGAETSPEARLANQTAENYGYKNFQDWMQKAPESAQRMLPKDVFDAASGAGEGTPLSTYLQVKSQMLKILRGTQDAALRFKIGQELDTMTSNVETALKASKNPDLLANWKTADKLWAKGYALRSLADALHDSIEGTPLSEQHPALRGQPPEVQGGRLVRELNDLAREKVLDRALTPDQAKALRQTADILDRAQETRIGHERMIVGGYSPHSAVWHTITDVIKSMGYAPVVKLMVDGGPKANAFLNMIKATTPRAAATFAAQVQGNQAGEERQYPTAQSVMLGMKSGDLTPDEGARLLQKLRRSASAGPTRRLSQPEAPPPPPVPQTY